LAQQLLLLFFSLLCFFLIFLFYLTIFCLFFCISALLVFYFLSLSYPDLSHCDTDDGTRTLDPHWWRVNKPSQGVPEALLDYRPKEGWLKGILIKRKSRGKTTWWQSEKFKLALEFFLVPLTFTLKCFLSLSPHLNNYSLWITRQQDTLGSNYLSSLYNLRIARHFSRVLILENPHWKSTLKISCSLFFPRDFPSYSNITQIYQRSWI